MKVLWSEFKPFIQTRSLSIQWVVVGDNYVMRGIDGFFSLLCIIPTDRDLSPDTIDFEDNFKAAGNKSLPQQVQPFASKSLPNGKKLFKRYHGEQYNVTGGVNTLLYTISYSQVKIVGVDVINAEAGDRIDLLVLDSITGTYTTVPNYILNQFAFGVSTSKDFFRQESNYDADLYLGMQIKIVFTSQSDKTIGINFNLSEVK